MIQRSQLLSTQLFAFALAASIPLVGCSKEEDVSQTPVPTPTVQAKLPSGQIAQSPGNGQPVANMQNQGKGDTGVNDARETMHDMLPPDTILWMEFESFDELAKAFEMTVGESLDGVQGPSNPEAALDLLRMMGMPVDRLHRDQPFGVALSLELGVQEPKFSLMVPMSNPVKTAEELSASSPMAKAVAQGDYVLISNRTLIDSDGPTAQAFAGTRGDSLFGLRVDVARLMDRYGADFRTTMEGLKNLPALSGNGSPARQMGTNAAEKVVATLANGIKTISLRMDLGEKDFEMELLASLRSGSVLSELGSNGGQDLEGMLRYVDIQNDEFMVGVARKQAIQFLGDPIAELFDELAIQNGSDSLIPAYQAALAHITGESVNMALAMNEANGAMFINGVDSEKLLPLIETALEDHLPENDDLTLMPPRKGSNETSRFAQYDIAATVGSPMVDSFKQAFGQPRVRLRLLGQGSESMFTIGEGDTYLSRKENANPEIPGGVAWALSRVEGKNPAFVNHSLLTGGVNERVGQLLMDGLSLSTPIRTDGPKTWVTSYMAMGQTEWSMGMRVDMKALMTEMKYAMEMGAAFAQPR